jgi:hypothetical protein
MTSLLDWIPTNLHAAIIAGTNTTDLTTYVQNALNSGGVIDTLSYSYLTLGLTISAPGTRLTGAGRFLLLGTAPSGTVHLQISASSVTIEKEVVFDGNSIVSAAIWVYGIRNTGQVCDLELLCRIENYSFTALEIHDGAGTFTNWRLRLGAVVTNVGWAGIVAHGVNGVDFTHSRVRRTGYHGYDIQGCSHATGPLRVDRSLAPYRVYNGPGSTSTVFCVCRFNNTDETYFGCDLVGNGSGDIWGLSEGGQLSPNCCNRTTVSGIFTDLVNETGFDITSDMTADVVLKGPNCFLGLDYGGIIENVNVRAVVEGPIGDAACRFPPTIQIARTVNTTLGSPTITVTGDPTGSGGYLLPGVIVSAAGIPPGTTVLSISGSDITLSKSATSTQADVSATFRGKLVWRNIDLTLVVRNANYALAIWDALATSYGSFSNVNIRIVADVIALADVIVYPTNKLPPGVRIEVVSALGQPKSVSIVSGGFSVVGRSSFLIEGEGPLLKLTDGYPGQDISCYVSSADIKLDFDWPDSGGGGEHRLLGAGNTDVTIKPGGCFRATRRYQGGWYVYAVVNPY